MSNRKPFIGGGREGGGRSWPLLFLYYNTIFLCLLLPEPAAAQCKSFLPSESGISTNTIDALLTPNTKILTSGMGIIERLSPAESEMCSWEIQAPEGYVIDLELRPGDDDAAIAVYSPAFISNGQLSILDGKGIFGGRTVRTFDGSTLEDDQGFPFRFSSTTNTMGIVTTTDNTVGIVTSTENTMGIVTTTENTIGSYVWFRSVYAIRRNDDDSMFDMMPAGK